MMLLLPFHDMMQNRPSIYIDPSSEITECIDVGTYTHCYQFQSKSPTTIQYNNTPLACLHTVTGGQLSGPVASTQAQGRSNYLLFACLLQCGLSRFPTSPPYCYMPTS